MEDFPFTDAEWEPVEDAALALVNASMAEDEVLRESLRLEMLDLLSDLRQQYGDHPFLLELVADYTDGDDRTRAALYQQALDIAVTNGLPTFTIRLAFARLLLEASDPAAAQEQLLACEDMLLKRDESERAEWAELLEQVRQTNPLT